MASEPDAESIIENVTTATAEAGSIAADMALNCSMAINVGDEGNTSQISLLATADFALQCIEDPLAMSLDGTFSVSTMGESIDLIVKVYAVPDENGDYNTYIYTEDTSDEENGEWQVDTVSAEDFNLDALLEDSGNEEDADLSEMGISLALEDGTVDYEDAECYLISAIVDSEAFSSFFADALGEDIMGEYEIEVTDIQNIVDSLAINMEYYVNAETFMPVMLHLDLNDGDFEFLNEYIQSALGEDYSTAELVFNDISLDITFAYDDIEEITVPDEALQAATKETETEYVDSPDVGVVETEDETENETESESIYMVETADEDVSLDLLTSITIDGTDYTVPFNYDILTEAGWYTEETEETYTLELINDDYQDVYCYVRWVSDGYEYFMPEEIVGQDIGMIELMPIGTEDVQETNITFSGIGIGSTWEEVIDAFGLPTYCSSIMIGDTEVAYDYSNFAEDGTYYSLDFYIDANGNVCMAELSIY